MTWRIRISPALLISACILLCGQFVYAQFTIPGAEGAVIISMNPAYPGPNAAVDLTVQSGLYDVTQSTITWTANGKVIAQGDGVTKAHLTTGAIGTATDVQVFVSADNGDASTEITIVPSSVDLLWQSDSYTPPFYRGRALASAGSTITVVAIPHLVRPNGSAVTADQLNYVWKKNGITDTSVSGKGRSSATFDSPMLYGTDSISLVVSSSDGAVTGSAALRISDTQPQLVLYEDDPLFGVLYHKAIIGTLSVPESEMSFMSVPYFAPTHTASDPQLGYTWNVNDKPVTVVATKPNEITINADGSTGIANIDLELTHATNYFLDAKNSWSINFSSAASNGGSGGASDPFQQ